MNTEHLANLQPGKSISGVSIAKADLSEKMLPRFMANDVSFSEIDFLRADLTFTRWRLCILKSVSFDNNNASSSILRMCTFKQVSAKSANFSKAVIENCQAHACDFSQVDFTSASLTDSDFNRSNFSGSDLTNADASYCNMRGVDFDGVTGGVINRI